ncbi:MAG TPA: DPP IV N-terminal domain-containing protein, partial [Anaeromyxobacteraceae bacterium]|nr:DPP IV N-terminal domain-containing protein [Anaeromyxobacteraceae bacterium]
MLALALALVGAASPAAPAPAPASPPAAEPFLRRYVETRRFTAGRPARPVLTPDGDAVLFLRSGPRDAVQALFATDLASGETRELASAARLLAGAAAATTAAEQAQLERQRITARGITSFTLSRDGRRVAVTVGGKLFLVDRRSGAATPLRTGGRPLDVRFSPDGATLSYVVDDDLRLLDLATNAERPLTTGGTPDVPHGLAEFVAQEELGRFEGHWWSPDSRLVLWQETDQREVEPFTIHDPLHPERPADTFRYPRAGRANARVRLAVTPAAGGAPTWIDWDRDRWPYLGAVEWPERGPLSLVVLDRRQTALALLAADPATGRTRVLLEEHDPAWVNLPAGFPRWLEDGSGFLWRTERSGAPEIERRAPDGALVDVWVRKDSGLAGFVGFDERRRWLWFTGGPSPAEARLYVVKDRAAPVEWLPSAVPVTLAAKLSRNGEVLLVTRSTLGAAAAPAAHRVDGLRLAELPSVAEPPPFEPKGDLRRVGPGAGFWATVVRPRGARPGTKLPVLLEVYGGPHAQLAVARPEHLAQWIADQGWVYVAIDGRGTPRRGRDFERAIQGDFAGPALDDQVAALRALAAEVPELDLDRVGVFGWSFGGYFAALAVMRYPELFKAAVAGAPVVDWRDYDTCYTERYLGLPADDPAAYERSSLLGWAPRLARPLLLVHGTADDNVYFFNSLKLSDALLRAGKRHELLVLPGLTHLALATADPALAERIWERMLGFLAEHLA